MLRGRCGCLRIPQAGKVPNRLRPMNLKRWTHDGFIGRRAPFDSAACDFTTAAALTRNAASVAKSEDAARSMRN